MKKEKEPNDLQKRIYNWALDLVRFVDSLSKDSSTRIITNQLLRSGTSVGANYIESQAGSSRKDFANFLYISLKSANESKYWLALLRDTKKCDQKVLDKLLGELEEISKILAASIITIKKKE